MTQTRHGHGFLDQATDEHSYESPVFLMDARTTAGNRGRNTKRSHEDFNHGKDVKPSEIRAWGVKEELSKSSLHGLTASTVRHILGCAEFYLVMTKVPG